MHRVVKLAAALALTGTPLSAQLVSIQMDYPPAALKAGAEGVVGFDVNIARSGRVTDCTVTKMSGHVELDEQTCKQFRQTGQFKPAVDASGKSIPSTFAGKLRWTIPHDAPKQAVAPTR